MSDVQVHPAVLDEQLRIHLWRLAQLVQVGYPDLHALVLAADAGVDLEQARRLVRLGCPPDLAVRILA